MMAIPGFAGTTLKTGSPAAGQPADMDNIPADEFAALFAASITNESEPASGLPETQTTAPTGGIGCEFLGDMTVESGKLQAAVSKILSMPSGEAQELVDGQDAPADVPTLVPALAVKGAGNLTADPDLPGEPVSKNKDKEEASLAPQALQVQPAAFIPAQSPVPVVQEVSAALSEVKSDASSTPVEGVKEAVLLPDVPRAERDSATMQTEVLSQPLVETRTKSEEALPERRSEPGIAIPTTSKASQPAARAVTEKLPDIQATGERIPEAKSPVTSEAPTTRQASKAVNSAEPGVVTSALRETDMPVARGDKPATQPEAQILESGATVKAEAPVITERGTAAVRPQQPEAPILESRATVQNEAHVIPEPGVDTTRPQQSEAKPLVLPSGITVTSIEVTEKKAADGTVQEPENTVPAKAPLPETGYQKISEAIRSVKTASSSSDEDTSVSLPENAGDGKRITQASSAGDKKVSEAVSVLPDNQPVEGQPGIPTIKTAQIVSRAGITAAPVTSVKGSTRAGSGRVVEEADSAVPDKIETVSPGDSLSKSNDEGSPAVVDTTLSTSKEQTFKFRKDPLTWSAKPGTEKESARARSGQIPAARPEEMTAKNPDRTPAAARNSSVTERVAVKTSEVDGPELKSSSDDATSFVNSLTAANGNQQIVKDTGRAEAQPPAVQVAAKILETTTGLHRGETKSIKLSLSPEKLGRVDVEVRRDNDGRVTAILTADRTDAARAISEGLPGLRQHLEQNGVSVANLDVQTAGSQTQGNLANNSNNPHNPQQEVIRNPELSGAGPIGTEGQDPTKEDRLLNVLA